MFLQLAESKEPPPKHRLGLFWSLNHGLWIQLQKMVLGGDRGK